MTLEGVGQGLDGFELWGRRLWVVGEEAGEVACQGGVVS